MFNSIGLSEPFINHWNNFYQRTGILVNGVSYSDEIIKITNEGTYILFGTLSGQVKVSSTGTVALVLNGVTNKNSASNGIFFTKAYELDNSTFNLILPQN